MTTSSHKFGRPMTSLVDVDSAVEVLAVDCSRIAVLDVDGWSVGSEVGVPWVGGSDVDGLTSRPNNDTP